MTSNFINNYKTNLILQKDDEVQISRSHENFGEQRGILDDMYKANIWYVSVLYVYNIKHKFFTKKILYFFRNLIPNKNLRDEKMTKSLYN